jgi:hypothetical protein
VSWGPSVSPFTLYHLTPSACTSCQLSSEPPEVSLVEEHLQLALWLRNCTASLVDLGDSVFSELPLAWLHTVQTQLPQLPWSLESGSSTQCTASSSWAPPLCAMVQSWPESGKSLGR